MVIQHTYNSGVRLVIDTLPYRQSVSMGIYVGNGSRNEKPEQAGISHFIEHMLFKGTKTRTAQDIASEMDLLGGQLNAYTTREYTCFYARVLNDNFEIAADILADMFFNSKFDEKDIEQEAKVIVEEINMYEDTPDDLVYDQLQIGIWKNDNALGRPILGTAEKVKSYKAKNFAKYMFNHYRPDNTVLAVAGNIEAQRAIDFFGKYFDTPWQCGSEEPLQRADYQPYSVRKEKDIEQTHLCMTYEGIPIGSKFAYDMNVFNTIFGGSMSSRLYQSIREKNGLAYAIYSHFSCYRDNGIYTIYAGVGTGIENKTMELILQEIEGLDSNKITENDIERAKQQVKNNYLLSLDSTTNIIETLGRNMLLRNLVVESDEVVEKISKVTKESVYELIDLIFDKDKLSVSVVSG